MKKFKIFPLLIIFSFFILSPASANLVNSEKMTEIDNNIDLVASPAGYSAERSLEDVIATIIKITTTILGTIFLILAFWAGYSWMTAGGNEEKVKKSKTTVINLVIGLCLTIIVYALAASLGGLISGMLLAF